MQDILTCNNLSMEYVKTEYALENVNLTVPDEGAIIGLLGPNGSGKTTLIKLIVGLLTPTEGSVKVLGAERGVKTKSIISYLSDAYSLYENYTVQEQMNFYSDFFVDFDAEKAVSMFQRLGIDLNKRIKTLSKGNKEKVSLIFTLARRAKLYILDEPIAGVDPAAREFILETIVAMKDANATLIISTHLISEIEQYFDRVIFIKNGRIVLEGKTEQIRQEHDKSIDALFREVFKW